MSDESDLSGLRIASGLTPTQQIIGEDDVDTALLREMAVGAETFIRSYQWCGPVLGSFLGGGYGGIFGIFLFHILPTRLDVDSWQWIMVGDVPSAYLPLADCASPAAAYQTYMRGMSRWVDLARNGQVGTSADGVPPLTIPSTPEWAEKISLKLYRLSLTARHIFGGDGDDSILQ